MFWNWFKSVWYRLETYLRHFKTLLNTCFILCETFLELVLKLFETVLATVYDALIKFVLKRCWNCFRLCFKNMLERFETLLILRHCRNCFWNVLDTFWDMFEPVVETVWDVFVEPFWVHVWSCFWSVFETVWDMFETPFDTVWHNLGICLIHVLKRFEVRRDSV